MEIRHSIEGEGKVGNTNRDYPFSIQANGMGASLLGGPRAFFSCFGGELTGTVNLAVVALLLGARRGGCHQGELAGAAGVGQGWGRAGGGPP